ncbi:MULTISPECIES: tlde1 domain-containing protein [Sphingomonas]|jgi:hypothetical protein|uniref:Tlde1 domain-containing protein n=1 Tax=Sphingomonas hankookensis TaxID=563996 RepID=A0ABR5YED3_9SPHN|nr:MULTISPECIES: tlde1 domain-containing protein [Sphingomonas]KZE17711.1 hypothetical protein AVT10_10290 [Sphingomonas hankookensis]PZT95830.1 MAG: DUF2778 domain-containing protein [Sphingomonas sp.]RSV28673.1 DUF2778 domain-containing protein [Sphingomonas sp. ABOLH]WCP72877.1 DUF2778 domain-containing protein [Sphingomonas hankookensis]
MPQDRYAHERGDPAVPQCGRSPVHILFDGRTLTLRGPRLQYSWSAVSGRPDARGNFDYSAERQRLGGEGPIPAGEYWINPAELWERSWYRYDQAAPWGDYRVTLHVMPATVTHRRGGFFIHGGSTPGSAGCIDLTNDMRRFVARLREMVGPSPDCFVTVTVRY